MQLNYRELDLEGLIADTCALINCDSQNPGGTEETTVDTLEQLAHEKGLYTRRWTVAPGRDNLLISTDAAGNPDILFLGHSDVVPAGLGWAADPFVARVGQEYIIGRGSTDMKGGLAAVLMALARIQVQMSEASSQPGDDTTELHSAGLLVTVDEELAAIGMQHVINNDYGLDPRVCIVAEPTDMQVIIGARGAANMTIDILGASAHAGDPSQGESAISAAAKVVNLVDGWQANAQQRPLGLDVPSWNVGLISGGQGPSMVADHCQLAIDHRFTPGTNPQTIMENLLTQVNAMLPAHSKIHLSGSLDLNMPGFQTAEDELLTQELLAVLTDLGVSTQTNIWTASCEAGFIADHYDIPVVICGPGDLLRQAHQPEEQVAISQLEAAAQTYELLCQRLSEAWGRSPDPVFNDED